MGYMKKLDSLMEKIHADWAIAEKMDTDSMAYEIVDKRVKDNIRKVHELNKKQNSFYLKVTPLVVLLVLGSLSYNIYNMIVNWGELGFGFAFIIDWIIIVALVFAIAMNVRSFFKLLKTRREYLNDKE